MRRRAVARRAPYSRTAQQLRLTTALQPSTIPIQIQVGLLAYFMYPANSIELALIQTLERNVLHYDWAWQKRTRTAPVTTPALAVLDVVEALLEAHTTCLRDGPTSPPYDGIPTIGGAHHARCLSPGSVAKPNARAPHCAMEAAAAAKPSNSSSSSSGRRGREYDVERAQGNADDVAPPSAPLNSTGPLWLCASCSAEHGCCAARVEPEAGGRAAANFRGTQLLHGSYYCKRCRDERRTSAGSRWVRL